MVRFVWENDFIYDQGHSGNSLLDHHFLNYHHADLPLYPVLHKLDVHYECNYFVSTSTEYFLSLLIVFLEC